MKYISKFDLNILNDDLENAKKQLLNIILKIKKEKIMGLKTIPFRDIEHQAENMYEAVVAMFGQAKEELNEDSKSNSLNIKNLI